MYNSNCDFNNNYPALLTTAAVASERVVFLCIEQWGRVERAA